MDCEFSQDSATAEREAAVLREKLAMPLIPVARMIVDLEKRLRDSDKHSGSHQFRELEWKELESRLRKTIKDKNLEINGLKYDVANDSRLKVLKDKIEELRGVIKDREAIIRENDKKIREMYEALQKLRDSLYFYNNIAFGGAQ